MNNGFDPALWADWFVATGLIGAVLAGFVSVALAFHLREVLGSPGASQRVAVSMVLLVSPALGAVAGLWPLDTAGRVGIAVAVVGAACWIVATWLALRARRRTSRGSGSGAGLWVVAVQPATLPVVLGGLSFATGIGLGFDYLPVGTVCALVGGLIGAWSVLATSVGRGVGVSEGTGGGTRPFAGTGQAASPARIAEGSVTTTDPTTRTIRPRPTEPSTVRDAQRAREVSPGHSPERRPPPTSD